MSIKRLFTLLSISIVIILANQSSFASNESIINEHITTIISNSDSNGSISLVRKINDLQELESDMNKEIISGKEYIVDTYSDGSFLSFVAEDIPKSNLKSYIEMLGSGPVYTQSRQFTYTYTNILGINKLLMS